MTDSYRALCNDSYVNMKVQTKMELPRSRETVLELFERVRRQFPHMNSFRRYRDELALESPQSEQPHRWLAIRNNTLRTGSVNAPSQVEAYGIHEHIIEVAPPYLSLSPLDIDFVELLYGFDLRAGGNHDAIVLDALIPGSPLAALLEIPGAVPSDCQPIIGMTFGNRGDTELYFEVKTRAAGNSHRDAAGDPISVYLTLRKSGPFTELKELYATFQRLARLGEELVERRVVPGLIVPIRQAIASGNV
ncbi:MAG: hypothetical protein ACOYN0_03295 [Phycisphaerales bacterium]